jgi:hypothetical protein
MLSSIETHYQELATQSREKDETPSCDGGVEELRS